MLVLKPLLLLYTTLLLTGGSTLQAVTAQEKSADTQHAPSHILPKPHPDVQALLDKANALAQAYKLPEAMQSYEAALAKARSLQDRVGEATTLTDIGMVYWNRGQLPKALEYLTQALPITRAVGDRAEEAITLNTTGRVYASSDQLPKALEYLMQALPIAKSVGNTAIEAYTLTNIGIVYGHLGQPQKALEYYEQALPLHRAVGNRVGEANTLRSIGIIYASSGQSQKALEYYLQALPLARAVGEKAFEATTLTNIGNVYWNSGQPHKALEYYEQALPIHKAVGNRAGESGTLNNIGIVYDHVGRPQKALEYYQQALPMARAVGDRAFEAAMLTNIGNVYRNIDQPQKALEYYEQALPIQKAIGNTAHEATTLNNVAYAEQNLHQPQQALTHARQSVALLEQLRANLGGYSEAKATFLAQYLSFYYHALQLLLEQHLTEDAFALAQQTKARALLDLLASGQVDLSAALTLEERQQEQALRQQADTLNQQMMKEGVENKDGAKLRFATLQGDLRQTEQKLQTFTDILYARHPDLANKRVARTATLADLAHVVPEDTALLDYIQVTDDQLTLFVVTTHTGKAHVQEVTLPVKADVLAKQCAAFHTACADPRQDWKPLARQLYRLLIQKAQPLLGGKKHLIVCPDGTLWDVAFSAFLDANDQTLLACFTLSMAYSATGAQAGFASQPHRRPVSGNLLCFANPYFGGAKRFGDLDALLGQRPLSDPSRPLSDPSRPLLDPSRPLSDPSRPLSDPSRPLLPPSRQMQTLALRGGIRALPGTQREADMLQRLFPDAHIYTGKAAQEATFKQEAGQYRYLHFATHGFFNDASPLLSSLVLAQPPAHSQEDGFLTAREIFSLHLNAELAVLSACNTGRGRRRSGEGVVGLTWALFVAGCPSCVVSGWAVDDAATAMLMGTFYKGLKVRQGKASALRTAALRLHDDGVHGHPYYWAAFSLVGAGR